MLIQTRTIVTQKGFAEQVVERFSQPSLVDGREGLIDRTVMVNKRSKETDEIMVMIRWESEEAWKAWEKSPEHIQGHRDKKDSKPPEFVISTTVNMYEVKTTRFGPAAAL